jgi:hypothetical protein
LQRRSGTSLAGGLPTLMDLEVPRPVAAAHVPDGPAPVRAFVEAPNGEAEGEIIVWLKKGYLDGLEFAWYTDISPSEMPSPDRIRMEGSGPPRPIR